MSEIIPNPWEVSETNFPTAGTPGEKLRFLLNYAVLAPSRHNVQPWLFHIVGNTVEIYVDRSRTLPAVDPDDRDLIISCGAAMTNLLVAIRHFGYAGNVEIHSHQSNPNLLARVTLDAGTTPTATEEQLFHAILQRRTNRHTFTHRQIPHSVGSRFADLARQEGARFQLIERKEDRRALLNLVAAADAMLWANPRFRDEVKRWTRPPDSTSRDGVPMSALGQVQMASYLGPMEVRTLIAEKRETQSAVSGSPVLAILWTTRDSWSDWLAAGRALETILLYARANEVWASFLNQPLAIPTLRKEVGVILHQLDRPQLVLRMGYGSEVPPTPRRSVSHVLL
jgi:hypothetical protein